MLFSVALWAIVPQAGGVHLKVGGWTFDRSGFRLGLDLAGGVHMLLQADMSKVAPGDQANALQGVILVIQRRINALGVTEPVVQAQGQDHVIVELPGVKDVNQAISLIGQTAQLDFREQVTDKNGQTQWVVAQATGSDGKQHDVTGQYFQRADVAFDPTTGAPMITFQFNGEGAKLFQQITQRDLGKPLGIFLDNQLISAPIVQAVISNSGQITGNFTLAEAKNLAIELNAGALPVPVKVVDQQVVTSMFSAVTITRTFLRMLTIAGLSPASWLFGLERPSATATSIDANSASSREAYQESKTR